MTPSRRLAFLSTAALAILAAHANYRVAFADGDNRPIPTPPTRKPSLQILYEGSQLSGRTFIFPTQRGLFTLSSWQVKNNGTGPTPAALSAQLYFSASVGSLPRQSMWKELPSTDPSFPTEFYWRSPAPVNAGEIWDLPEFENGGAGLTRSVRGKLMIFYGADTPAQALFLLRPINRPPN